MRLNQRQVQIRDSGTVIDLIIERNLICHRQEFPLFVEARFFGYGVVSDVGAVNGSFRQFFRCFVGSVGASGCPDNQDLFILKINRLNDGYIMRS